jgi:hypothetical protein
METAIRRPLADDTPFEVEDVQLALWRAMTPTSKAQVISSICRVVHDLAVVGVARRHPGASPREQFLRLAVVRLGYDLAVEAFPDVARLCA